MLTKTETVNFDPSKKEHRAAVHAFMRRRAWVDSPIRFSHDPEYGSIVEQVHAKLVMWYLDKEYKKPTKKAPARPPEIIDFKLSNTSEQQFMDNFKGLPVASS